MYACVAISRLSPASLERTREEIVARAVPGTSRVDGFLGGAWLADPESGEVVALMLLEDDVPELELGADTTERWDVKSFVGKLGGAWCLVHRLSGDALPSVLDAAVDWAVGTSGNVGAVGLVDREGRHGVVYAFSERRPSDSHGGRLYQVLATA